MADSFLRPLRAPSPTGQRLDQSRREIEPLEHGHRRLGFAVTVDHPGRAFWQKRNDDVSRYSAVLGVLEEGLPRGRSPERGLTACNTWAKRCAPLQPLCDERPYGWHSGYLLYVQPETVIRWQPSGLDSPPMSLALGEASTAGGQRFVALGLCPVGWRIRSIRAVVTSVKTGS
jgi:hypothetical protein